MGIVNFGVPLEITKWLQSQLGLDVFVESGTYQGGTARTMSGVYREIYTIERSDVMHTIAKQNLKDIGNITLLKGDTRDHLQLILEDKDNILFWLDAHWSGGETYGEDDECPLLEELRIIFASGVRNFAILIDDARLFLAPPPHPHNPRHWPSIKDISVITPDECDLIVAQDVVYIVPSDISFRTMMQEITTAEWIKSSTNANPNLRKSIQRIANFFGRLKIRSKLK